MEGAVGTFRATAAKIGHFHKAVGLCLDSAQYRRNGQADFRRFQTAPAKIGNGLNMNATDMGRTLQGKFQNVAQRMVIDTGCNGGHQHHGKTRRLTVINSLDLRFQQRRAPQRTVNGILKTVKLQKHHADIDESIITDFLCNGTADVSEDYLATMRDTAKEYVSEIFRRLREHNYNPNLMKLHIVGGGGCLIKNFTDYDKSRVYINGDICATAKGYEYLAELILKNRGER